MSSSNPPTIISSNFNYGYYTNLSSPLTLGAADSRYLRLIGGILNGNLSINGVQTITSNSGDLITLNTTDSTGRSTVKYTTPSNTMEIGLRAPSTGSYPSSYYRYMNGSFRYVQDATSGQSQHFGQYIIDTSTSHLTLKNGSNVPFLETSGSGLFRIVNGSLALNLDVNGLRIDNSANSARSRIDLGSSASDRTISIFNNTTSYYGISANNNALQYSSNLNHLWTTGATDASPLGSTIMSMNNTGSLTCYDNTIMKKGFFIERQAFSSTGRSGRGISAFYANADAVAKIFAYDYGASSYNGLQLGNCMLVSGNSGGTVTIDNGVTTSGSYPLSVNSFFNTSFGGSYGYIGGGGAGTGVGTGACDVSIYANKRVWTQEVNAFSDRRLKENFNDISEDDAVDFIKNVKAKSYNWKTDKNKCTNIGYVAQDILKFGKFNSLVSLGPDEDLQEEIDEDNFVSPAKHRFLVSYQAAVPVLHAAISQLIERIESLEEAANKPKRGRPKKND